MYFSGPRRPTYDPFSNTLQLPVNPYPGAIISHGEYDVSDISHSYPDVTFLFFFLNLLINAGVVTF